MAERSLVPFDQQRSNSAR